MKIDRIVSLIKNKGANVAKSEESDLMGFDRIINKDLQEYLHNCLSVDGVFASGIRVKNMDQLKDENFTNASPGGFIFHRGFLVIATSIGGNAVVVDSIDCRVYWANSSNFLDDEICFEDSETGDWRNIPYSHENIVRALIPLGDDFESFLIDLFEEKLESRLYELDK